MTEAADLLLTNAEVHTLAGPGGAADTVHEAVAVRDGRIVRVGTGYDLQFLADVETRVVDLEGRVLLPGFVDAHTHLNALGRRLTHANLAGTSTRAACLDRLRERAEAVPAGEWIVGFGYDESDWDEPRHLERTDLDEVSTTRPVAAVREDMHVASLNTAALDRLGDRLPEEGVHRAGGEPTGVVVEEAAQAVYDAVEDDEDATTHLREAQARAVERGVTAVHEMVDRPATARAVRGLDLVGDLAVRVRLNYGVEHLDALLESGLRTNHGSGMVRTGAVKLFADGSLGGRTARLSAPYDDAPGTRGQWVVPPEELASLVERADAAGFQCAVHAIGDEAVDATLDAFEGVDDAGAARHRIEHAELSDDDAVERLAALGAVASVQPNFLKWTDQGGLYARRLGDRRHGADRFGALDAAGVPLAFGSDCMPLDPLFGVHHAVNASQSDQRLGVTAALAAYTRGGAYAGFDEDRLGTVEVGKRADLVALERSPWDDPDQIREIDVALTAVDGDVVHDGR